MEFNGQKREFSGIEGNSTNNRMEIWAAIGVLEAIKIPCNVTIVSDSQYLVNTIVKKWKRMKNVDLWDRLQKCLDFHSVTFKWVKGHNTNPGNIRADELAVEARIGLKNKLKKSRHKEKIKFNKKYHKQTQIPSNDGGCIINISGPMRNDVKTLIRKLTKKLPPHFTYSRYDNRRYHNTETRQENTHQTQSVRQ